VGLWTQFGAAEFRRVTFHEKGALRVHSRLAGKRLPRTLVVPIVLAGILGPSGVAGAAEMAAGTIAAAAATCKSEPIRMPGQQGPCGTGGGLAAAVSPKPQAAFAPVTNSFQSVYARTPTDAWAVGSSSRPPSAGQLIEHWDGSSWFVFTTFPGLNASLTAVTANSPTDIWAVGSSVGGW